MSASTDGYGGMGGIGNMGGMSSMEGLRGIGGYGGMEDIGAIGGIGGMRAPPGEFMASMVASMPSISTTNDGFLPCLMHITHAHTFEVADEGETKDGDAKDDGKGDVEC
jgi:hypothetical protein